MDLVIDYIKILMIAGFGLPLSLYDIREKRLPIILSLPALGTALLYRGIAARGNPAEFTVFAVTGFGGLLACLIIRVFTRGGIGLGDGIIMAFLGLFLGYRMMIATLLAASFGALAFCLSLYIKGKADRKTSIPFAPFLFAGGIVTAAIEIIVH